MKNSKTLIVLSSITGLLILFFVFQLANKESSHLQTEHVVPEVNTIKSDKSEITLTWPEPQNLNRTIKDRITHVTAYQNITGEPLEATQQFYRECECGVVGSTYEVHYDKNDLLSLSITVDYLRAYPFSETTHHSFNLTNGYELALTDIFQQDKLDELVELADKQLQENIKVSLEEAKQQNLEISEDLNKAHFTKENISNLIITKEGITFFYNFNFPHVIKAAEPKSDVSFTYEELKDFFAQEGLLKSKATPLELLTEEQAIDKVKELAEVQEWLKTFDSEDAKGKASFSITEQTDDNYTVQVFESLETHTATFNWWEVNKKTGEVKNTIIQEETTQSDETGNPENTESNK